MTTKEKIEVMEAYDSGKEIEYATANGEWQVNDNPKWNWTNYKYRVKSKQWQPKGGNWYVYMDGTVKNGRSLNESAVFGIERKTEEEAKEAYEAMRTHNRLLAYVAEFDSDWKADWGDTEQRKYCVYMDYDENMYMTNWSANYKHAGDVYMSQECVTKLVKKLNSGEVVL